MLLIIFLLVLAFNLAPAFTPPTWAVLSYIEVTYHPHSLLLLALIGAVAATIGRLVLAKLAKVVVRDRFFSQKTIQNLDAIKSQLLQRKKLTFSIFLFYAFSPLPSNQLFLAYGLTDLPLSLIILPFFIGRLVSYSFWIITASEIAKRLAANAYKEGTFLKSYFIIVQILTLVVVYLFTKIDWQRLIKEKKLGWIK